MLILAIASTLLGVLLGQRFKVFVLMPANLLLIPAVVLLGLARGDNAGALAMAIALIVTSLQMGYLAGAAGRLVGTLAKPPRPGSALHGPVR